MNEGRIVADLFLRGLTDTALRNKVRSENLFQSRSAGTTLKYLGMLLPRLRDLSREQLDFIVNGDEVLRRLTLFTATLRKNDLLAEFMREVVAEKLSIYDTTLQKTDWALFIESKIGVFKDIETWTTSSRKKICQVVFRILAEAGYIDNTKNLNIQTPVIPFELEEALKTDGEHLLLSTIKLERL